MILLAAALVAMSVTVDLAAENTFLLYLDGRDLRKEPQVERKRLLKELFDAHGLEPPAVYSEHLVGGGQ
ncbi:hypothetical protein AB7M17_007336 [Bradyrhizobium sp. USDA 377]